MDLDAPKVQPSFSQIIPEEEKLDHRRRRRNRMRASCLNCYASKRKCDKKRPCGRCMRLGTTGLCIYEIEDVGDGLMDTAEFTEVKRLRQRIAELESVIRELKKNPHPRWTAPGGVVHDPDFFDSFRKSTPQTMGECTRLPSRVDDATSMRVQVKAEEAVSCPPELVATRHSVLHGSSRGQSPQLFGVTISRSGNSEVTDTRPGINSTTTGNSPYDLLAGLFHNAENPGLNSKLTPIMHQSATSMNNVTACSPSAADSSVDTLFSARDPHSSSCAPTYNHGCHTTVLASVSQTNIPQSSHKSADPCNCLTDPMAFGPLLHLGISLRTSREALERLHSLSSNCMLYCRVSMLEKHIFSFPPHEKNIESNPSSDTCMGGYSSRAYTTPLPHSPSKEYLFPHPLSHSYSSTHQLHQLAPRTPDPFAYMDNTSCTPFRS